MRTIALSSLLWVACGASTGSSDLAEPDGDLSSNPADLSGATAPDLGRPGDGDGGCTPKTCADCGEHRSSCMEASGCVDAECGPCDSGYVEDDLRACREEMSETQCAALGRSHVAVTGTLGYCDGCLPTYDTVNGQCVPKEGAACTSRNCPSGQYCIQLGPDDMPECRPWPCAPEPGSGKVQVWNRAQSTCGSCAFANPWPVTDAKGQCLPDVDEGSFYNDSSHTPELCDGDGDHWLKKEVADVIRTATSVAIHPKVPDYALLLNTRCTFSLANEVDLVNEWGQSIAVGPNDGIAVPLTLFEASVADNERPDSSWPAASVNALTKGCVATGFDLNGNGLPDVSEAQDHTYPPTDTNVWAQPYQRLTHYVELHTVSFAGQPAAAKDDFHASPSCSDCVGVTLPVAEGTLTIAERKRAETTMTYGAGSGDYWKSCWRRLDAPGAAGIGYDFAWKAVTQLDVPQNALPMGQLRPHAEAGGMRVAPTAGDAWHGMGHFSQFFCGHVVADGAGTVARPDVPISQVSSGAWDALSCTAQSCVATAPTAGQVYWLARRYSSQVIGGQYQYAGGCINEAKEWPQLCPGNDPSDSDPAVIDDKNNFGLIYCGPACPKQERYLGIVGSLPFSVCMHPVASSFDGASDNTGAPRTAFDLPDGQGGLTWRITGEVPAYVEPLAPFTSTDWQVR